MSDGPHRSLKQAPHWRTVAQWAANRAHASAEICGALAQALKKDVVEAPISKVRDIMNRDTLFPEMRIAELETLRASHPRSAVANSLIDCAVEAVDSGMTGEAAMAAALSAALEAIARPGIRGIDEHYQREAGAQASRNVRTRLDEALGYLKLNELARELLLAARPLSRRAMKMPRQTGIDEGPSL